MFWIVIAEAWKETPFIMLNILAALSTIPEDLYEAAKVDGATGIQSFFRITLPIIKPTLFICLTLRTIWALKSFDLIYTLTAGGPGSSTTTVAYYTYQKSFTSLETVSTSSMLRTEMSIRASASAPKPSGSTSRSPTVLGKRLFLTHA